MTKLLAFDASTERLHIGLAVDDRVWSHEDPGGAKVSALLLPGVQHLLALAGLSLRELDAIAFGRGPGAFTGLRAACAAAQGLAFGVRRPVLPLDTLMAVAEDARARVGATDAWVAMDARMDEVYAAHYRWDGGTWHALVTPALYTLDALNALWRARPPAAIAGTAAGAFGERLCCGAARVVGEARPAARALVACARASWDQGGAVDPAAALPVYLRDKVALTSAERAAAKTARAAP